MEPKTHSYTTGDDAFAAMWPRYEWQTDEMYQDFLDGIRDAEVRRLESLARLTALLHRLPVPTPILDAFGQGVDWTARWYVPSIEQVRVVRRAIGTPGGGTWKKVSNDGSVAVELTVDRLRLVVAATAETCEAVVVGTEEADVNVEVCPDCEADLGDRHDDGTVECGDRCGFVRRPTRRVSRTVERDVIEWRCPDINGEAVA